MGKLLHFELVALHPPLARSLRILPLKVPQFHLPGFFSSSPRQHCIQHSHRFHTGYGVVLSYSFYLTDRTVTLTVTPNNNLAYSRSPQPSFGNTVNKALVALQRFESAAFTSNHSTVRLHVFHHGSPIAMASSIGRSCSGTKSISAQLQPGLSSVRRGVGDTTNTLAEAGDIEYSP